MSYQERALNLAENTFGKLPLITFTPESVKYDTKRDLVIVSINILINGDSYDHILKVFFESDILNQVGYVEVESNGRYKTYSSYELFDDNESMEVIVKCIKNRFVRRLMQNPFYEALLEMHKKVKRMEKRLQSYGDLVATLREYGPQHINKGSGKKYLRLLTLHFKYEEGASGYIEAKEDFESKS